MRVLLVSHAYIAPENRRKPMLLADKPGLEIGVIAPKTWKTWHGPAQEFARTDNDETFWTFPVQVANSGDGARYYYNYRELLSAVNTLLPDIIHVEEEPWSNALTELSFVTKVIKRKKLISFTWENVKPTLSQKQEWKRRFNYWALDMIIAGNKEARALVRGYGYDKEVELLPQFGVDTRYFKEKRVEPLKKKLGLSKFVIGYVGRFVKEKGIGTLIEAVGKLNRDFQLLLVSSGKELPDEFKNLAGSFGVFEKIVIASDIPHRDLPDYMNAMDVFVLPSQTTETWKEQFGRVLIEAMACEVPVIGSSSGAIPEVIEKAGLIYDEGNSDQLAEDIKKVMEDNRLRTYLSSHGLHRVNENYTFEKIADKTFEIYREVYGKS